MDKLVEQPKLEHRISCAHCNKWAYLQHSMLNVLVDEKNVSVITPFYQCEDCGTRFTTTESDTVALSLIRENVNAKKDKL